MTTLYINIKQLLNVRETTAPLRGNQLADLPSIENAFLLTEDDVITDFGAMMDLELQVPVLPKQVIDVNGKMILPAWCDSHTHLVFAGNRENEFVDKINGLSYAEIAAKGGGILNSARRLNEATEEELFDVALERLKELQRLGTGAIEIKSGYGLSVEGELKMLRVIRRLEKETGMLIRSTFLGAHTFPVDYREDHAAYIQQLIHEIMPEIQKEKLADYVDVFCETGFFSPAETETICQAAIQYGMKPKLHVNQLNSIGGIETGIRLNAVSLDHLETLSENEIRLLGNWKGISTLLPTAAFYLRMNYQPARALIEAGAAVALASDFNPGSSPSGNMNFVVALSCIQMKMLPEESINAATVNGAFAMEFQDVAGSIAVGKKANFIITKPVPSVHYLPYAFGSNLIDSVIISGKKVQ